MKSKYDKALGSMTKERIVDNNLHVHIPAHLQGNRLITGVFENFQRELAFLLSDHIAMFDKRLIDGHKQVCKALFLVTGTFDKK